MTTALGVASAIPNCNDGICQACGKLAFRRHMTQEHGIHPHTLAFHMLLKDIGDLHDRKSKDYGSEESPLANVISTEEWGMPGWVGSMVRLNDKVKRLQRYAQRGTLANESAEDSMLDIAVYALIALVLYREAGEEAPATETEEWRKNWLDECAEEFAEEAKARTGVAAYLSPDWFGDPTATSGREPSDVDPTPAYWDDEARMAKWEKEAKLDELLEEAEFADGPSPHSQALCPCIYCHDGHDEEATL